MSDTADRPNERSARVPLHGPIELGHGDFEDAFSADGVNLSRGGLSLRASCLPDPGSRLSIRFRCEPSGRLVSAQGEVVWAHLDGAQRGELGLAFVDLDAESEWLIEEMIAAHSLGASDAGAADTGPRVAQLELEGSSEPISARVVRADGDSVVFEQRLDLLELGRGVRAFAEGEQGHAGAIAAVELRMVGSVPMLAVTVAFDGSADSLAALEQDTEPDLTAPPEPADRAPRAGKGQNATLVEFHERNASARTAVPADREEALARSRAGSEAALDAAELDPHERPTFDPNAPAAVAAEPRVMRPAASEPFVRDSAPALRGGASSPPPQLEPTQVVTTEAVAFGRKTPHVVSAPRGDATPAARISTAPRVATAPAPSPVVHARDWSTSFTLDDPSGDPEPAVDPEQLELPSFEPEPPALQVALLALFRALRRHAARIAAAVRAALGAAYRSASPEVRAHVLRGGAVAQRLYSDRVGPQLGTMRRLVIGRLAGRRRRKTSSPQAAMAAHPRSGLGRTVLLGLVAACAIGLGVYALTPVGEDAPVLHRGVDPNAVAGVPLSPVSATAPVDLIGAPVLVAPDPKVVPSEHAVPASSPFAVDVREQKAAPARKPAAPAAAAAPASPAVAAPASPAAAPDASAAAPRKLRLGAATAPRGRRFALRMSNRIQTLTGSEDPGGFSVNIAGCLALDRAGPIASAHGAVERSMVINRGDHAELTIRFDPGKRPAYQVVAEGSTLYVTIQDL